MSNDDAELARWFAALLRGESPAAEPETTEPTSEVPDPAPTATPEQPQAEDESAEFLRRLFAPKAASVDLVQRLHGGMAGPSIPGLPPIVVSRPVDPPADVEIAPED
jgi:hypothetical protein